MFRFISLLSFAALPTFVTCLSLSSAVTQINNLFAGPVTNATYTSVFGILNQVTPGAAPATIQDAFDAATGAFVLSPSNLYAAAADLIASGISPGNLTQLIGILESGCNAQARGNPSPKTAVFPQKGSSDAPYSLTEDKLRAAIHIPSAFTYGKKPPVILVPGTGTTGCFSFTGNFIPLLTGASYADIVWLNIPEYLLDDVQVNAEYVAYAINYISAVSSNTNVSVIAWSQGNIDTQWALKYWPSTRSLVSDLVAISPDFHGTTTAYYYCPGTASANCVPSIIQQEYSSNLITTLRSNGGDSAYVPTTTLYSAADQVVQPQSGTGASAYLLDARGVGVTNNEVQTICPGQPAGGNFTHEGMLYNPVSYALAMDALTHSGPGQVSRLNLATVCAELASPGITAQDIVLSEETLVVFSVALALYEPKVITEPPIMSYAT